MQLTAGMPAMETRLCLDADTDKELMAKGMMAFGGNAPRWTMSQENGGYVIDCECTFGEMKSTTHTVMTGDFQSTYKIDITSDTEGGPKQMPPHSSITQTATWTGPCTDLSAGRDGNARHEDQRPEGDGRRLAPAFQTTWPSIPHSSRPRLSC